MRIDKGVTRSGTVTFTLNGKPLQAPAGETLASALLNTGLLSFNRNRFDQLRAPLCNMGTCYECLVGVRRHSGQPLQRLRACMTDVAEGMVVEAGADFSTLPCAQDEHDES